MKKIEHFEKHLPMKRKTLLYHLRENSWDVVEVDDDCLHWALEEKWLIKSTRENKGFALELWFFKYEGLDDGMDRVVATTNSAPMTYCYGGDLNIEFDRRKFETQLEMFVSSLHQLRINDSLKK